MTNKESFCEDNFIVCWKEIAKKYPLCWDRAPLTRKKQEAFENK